MPPHESGGLPDSDDLLPLPPSMDELKQMTLVLPLKKLKIIKEKTHHIANWQVKKFEPIYCFYSKRNQGTIEA